MAQRILLTGGSGQVGSGFQNLPDRQDFEIYAPDSKTLNLADANSIRAIVRDFKPDAIVNAAAYTKVDLAETEQEQAHAINAAAPGILGEEAKKLGTYVLHYSTDYVFSGTGDQPWQEEDVTDPQNVYGKSKRAGEIALQQSGADHAILRTSWVWGVQGNNFFKAVYKRALTGQPLQVVNDQVGAPTSAHWLAALALQAVQQKPQGIYHAQARDCASWLDVAAYFFQQMPDLAVQLSGIPTSAWPSPAKRPQNSRLSCTKLEQDWDVTRPLWQDELRAAIPALTEQVKKAA